MEKLNAGQYEALVAAIERKPYSEYRFSTGAHKLLSGSWHAPPNYTRAYCPIPQTATQFRANPSRSRRLLDRHQLACDAAVREFWRVFAEVCGDVAWWQYDLNSQTKWFREYVKNNAGPAREAANLKYWTTMEEAALGDAGIEESPERKGVRRKEYDQARLAESARDPRRRATESSRLQGDE